jgi:hypothetical protein
MMRHLLSISALVAATSCVVAGTVGDFKASALDRAAFEMSCAKEQIEVTQLADSTVGVAGCGKKLVYYRVPNSTLAVAQGRVPVPGKWVPGTPLQ